MFPPAKPSPLPPLLAASHIPLSPRASSKSEAGLQHCQTLRPNMVFLFIEQNGTLNFNDFFLSFFFLEPVSPTSHRSLSRFQHQTKTQTIFFLRWPRLLFWGWWWWRGWEEVGRREGQRGNNFAILLPQD